MGKIIRQILKMILGKYYDQLCMIFFSLKYKSVCYKSSKRMNLIRTKDVIRVVFVVTEVAVWKSEMLFLAMKEKTRFQAIILILKTPEDINAYDYAITYMKQKNYQYFLLADGETIDSLAPDLLFYQKPYENTYYSPYKPSQNSHINQCLLPYGIRSVLARNIYCNPINMFACQVYFENKMCLESVERWLKFKVVNAVVTGTPIQDELLVDKSKLIDPWKFQNRPKKRIIWAPHFSLKNHSFINYSTFLEYYNEMQNLACKYKDEIQFAFKPHPKLRSILVKIWGEEKTMRYYDFWNTSENTQLELGKYQALFAYSDAMIHDCSSFMQEYHYTEKPVLFLENENDPLENMNVCSERAYKVHYHARNISEIRDFIENVLIGKDPLYKERVLFKQSFLCPPHGKTACENIINAILGVEEYKDC